MPFNSLVFLAFFAATTVIYFTIPSRWRPWFLLAASYIFYLSWEPVHTVILALLTIFSYRMGILVGDTTHRERRRLFLGLSIAGNIAVLLWCKYALFFSETVNSTLSLAGIPFRSPLMHIALPVGISFYTLRIMNYLVDVYRGKVVTERRIGRFALFVAFFPQIVAGPIDRATNLLPQFDEPARFDYARTASGLRLMLWGLFQKMVIADTIAAVVDPVYTRPVEYSGPVLAIATLLFAVQIFCDFSGYSDIAIGAARVLGFQSLLNFDRPYFSSSIPEFWRRWHISLSTWFRDYLYIPLGGNRASIGRWCLNILVVFLLSGLWHGANWTFIVWGGLHGLYYLLSVRTQQLRTSFIHALHLDRFPTFHRTLQIGATFLLVTFAWIFFRANSLTDALYIVSHFLSGWERDAFTPLLPFRFELTVGVLSGLVLLAVELLKGASLSVTGIFERHIVLRWLLYYGLAAAILVFGNFESKAFIYFQF
jgi:alginate O-acetyltransferase complex protein AlgI